MRQFQTTYFTCLMFSFWLALLLVVSTNHVCADDFALDTDQFYGEQDVFITNKIPDISQRLPTDEELEAAGAVIGKIYIHVKDVFNLQNPKENKSIFRFANKLHITTNQYVIQNIILFKSSDKYSRSVLSESERNLRNKNYLYDARILPVRYEGNQVDVVIIVRDVWTLALYMNLSREGGKNSSRFGIRDSNVLGTGQSLGIERRNGLDRDEVEMSYVNEELFNTHNKLALEHSDNSDGKSDKFELIQPFYSLDSRWSSGISSEFTQQIDSRYEGGEATDRYQNETTNNEIHIGFSRGLIGDTTLRWTTGIKYHKHYFSNLEDQPDVSLPRDSHQVYPFIGLEKAEDRYLRTRRVLQIGGTEDINLGIQTNLTLGFLSKALGSDRDGFIYDASMETGFLINDNQYLFLELHGSGRVEDEPRDLVSSTTLQYLYSISSRQSYYMKLEFQVAGYTGGEDYYDLGAEDGLRGYPLHYQSGNRSALFTIERRYYTDIELWRLAHVGGAVFFDIGRAWDSTAVDNPYTGVLRDIGFGLRLASTRTSDKRVFNLDFTFPLDGDDSISDFEFYFKSREQF